MKHRTTMMSLLALLAAVSPASADAAADTAQRDCGPRNLAVCQTSNDLFWGSQTKSGKAAAKHEFRDALKAFLHNAPPVYAGGARFDEQTIASTALVGPGDHHDRLPGSKWFFDGFWPHDALTRAAAIFGSDGKILLVASLDTFTDAAAADSATDAPYRLRIYSHGKADGADIRLLQNWAGYAIKSDNRRGAPQERLAGTQLVTLEDKTWRRAP